MGTKMAVAFANIFMAKIEKEILRQNSIKPLFWKRFIDDVISARDTSRNEIEEFLLQANNLHRTIKFYHGWNIRNRDYIRCQIQQGFYPWRANTLQAYRNIPLLEFVLVSPTRRHKRLYHRRSLKASKNKFLWNHFWREHEEFFNTPQE